MPNAQPYSETCLDVDNVVWIGNLEEIDAETVFVLQIVQGPGGDPVSGVDLELDGWLLLLLRRLQIPQLL